MHTFSNLLKRDCFSASLNEHNKGFAHQGLVWYVLHCNDKCAVKLMFQELALCQIKQVPYLVILFTKLHCIVDTEENITSISVLMKALLPHPIPLMQINYVNLNSPVALPCRNLTTVYVRVVLTIM